MLVALGIIISAICKSVPGLNLGTGLRITIENFPIVMAGMMFGPIIGACVGSAVDLVGSIATGQDLSIFVNLGSLSVGLVAGLCSKLVKKNGVIKFAIADIFAQIVGSMIIKTIALQIRYQWGSILLVRIPLYIIIIAIEIMIFNIIYKNKTIQRIINSYIAGGKNELR